MAAAIESRRGVAERLAGHLRIFGDRRVVAVLFLGFASGLPIMLVGSTLSAWLREAEVSRSTIGLFAYVFSPYTFKFAWAPLMDRLPLPWLTARLGRRRGWMLVAQAGLVASILALGQTDPRSDLMLTATMAFLVAFFSASQDTVIDAYRIEILPPEQMGTGAGVIMVGYRTGMWVATAGALLLADGAGWTFAYTAMAALVLVGTATVLLIDEPAGSTVPPPPGRVGLGGWLKTAVADPVVEFFGRRGVDVAVAILAFISLFKACDVLLTLMANPFYVDLGFTKTQIALVSGTLGLFMTLLGALVGGVLVYRLGLLRALIVGALLQAGSNLMFAALASAGPDLPLFVLTIVVENVSGGLGTAVFVAYLSSLCNIHYTAFQYALLTSLMQLLGKYLIVPSSGFYADAVGWHLFFVSSTLLALPGLVLLWWLQRRGVGVAPPRDGPAAVPAAAA
jgi:MFS transporter, PAT family, beta-lactamase induction signal transducer AmpG